MIIEVSKQKVQRLVRMAEELSKTEIPHIDPEGPLGRQGTPGVDNVHSIPTDYSPDLITIIIKE